MLPKGYLAYSFQIVYELWGCDVPWAICRRLCAKTSTSQLFKLLRLKSLLSYSMNDVSNRITTAQPLSHPWTLAHFLFNLQFRCAYKKAPSSPCSPLAQFHTRPALPWPRTSTYDCELFFYEELPGRFNFHNLLVISTNRRRDSSIPMPPSKQIQTSRKSAK